MDRYTSDDMDSDESEARTKIFASILGHSLGGIRTISPVYRFPTEFIKAYHQETMARRLSLLIWV